MEDYQNYVSNSYDDQLAKLRELYDEIAMLRDQDVDNAEDYEQAMADIMEDMNIVKLSKARTFFGTLSQLQSSHIRGMAAVGKAAAIAEATINTYVGATVALRQGGIWGALEMGAVLAAGFAQVAEIAAQGFKGGGYTGGAGLDQIAGVVHGQEFVMNSDATAAYLPLLQALNSGHSVGSQMDSGPSFNGWPRQQMNVSIANYGTSKSFDVQAIDENNIRIIARDEARRSVYQHAPDAVANDLGNSNSRTSKAMGQRYGLRRDDR
jgi:hypothetical protein